jgi:hypothetical protein
MPDDRPRRGSRPPEDRSPRTPAFTTGKYRDVARRGSAGPQRTTGTYSPVAATGDYPPVSGLRSENTRSGVAPSPRGLQSSWTVAILATIAVTASLIFVAWAKMQTVQYTYTIDALVDAEEDLANRQRILRSELAALRSPAKLHALAPGLGLAPPEPGHVVVITGDPEGLAAALADDPTLSNSTPGGEDGP